MSDIIKIHFDTEFDGLRKDTDLISIGLICEYPGMCKAFYGEVKDFQTDNEWIEDNILSNLFNGNNEDVLNMANILKKYNMCTIKNIVYIEEDIETLAEQLILWIEEIHDVVPDRKIQFVSDCSSYDWVLLVDLLSKFKTALDIPEYVIPYCHDINQDIALEGKIDNNTAFDINREEYANIFMKYGDEKFKHNSLWDAGVIKRIDERIIY